jgi:hypothetical protein
MSAKDNLWDIWARFVPQINCFNINVDTIKLSCELTAALREVVLEKGNIKYVLEWEGRYLKTCYKETGLNVPKVTNVDKLSDAMLFDSKSDSINYALKWDLGHKPVPVQIEKVILP